MPDSFRLAPVSSLQLTGELRRGRVVVWVDEQIPVMLPTTRFAALATLVLCRLTKSRGYATSRDFGTGGQLLQQTIRRLRCDFDEAVGANAGAELVHNVGRETYSLQLPVEAITVEREVIELAPDYISASIAEAMIKAVQDCQRTVNALSAGHV
jgi:hypothetical protein